VRRGTAARGNHNQSASFPLLEKMVTVPADGRSTLDVVFIYEDTETREWAREAHERLLSLAGTQPVRPTWWKLSNLGHPGVLAAAVSTAMRAEVIVVAMRGTEGLPLPFYAWISSWTPNRLQVGGVLTAILGKCHQGNAKAGRVGDYLRAVAKQARLGFILEQRKTDILMNGCALAINGHHADVLSAR